MAVFALDAQNKKRTLEAIIKLGRNKACKEKLEVFIDGKLDKIEPPS